MTRQPDRPKIYHITHVDNLGRIVADGELMADREILARGGPARTIGMSGIKKRRVEELYIDRHPGTANHRELAYRGGQEPIIHLQADLYEVIRWAGADGTRWAFSLSNAGARYAEFRSRPDELGELDWGAIEAWDFRSAEVRAAKQAEFLVYERFPFDLVERIGVRSARVQGMAEAAVGGMARRPRVEVRPEWYS